MKNKNQKENWEKKVDKNLDEFIDDNFQILWNYSRMDKDLCQELPNNAQEAIKFIIKTLKDEK